MINMPAASSSHSSQVPFLSAETRGGNATSKMDYASRIFAQLSRLEETLDRKIGTNCIQKVYDDFIYDGGFIWIKIEGKRLEEFGSLHEWLQASKGRKWSTNLEELVATLFVKAMWSLPVMLMTAINISLVVPTYFLMHPMKFFLKGAKMVVTLTQIESLISIGGGLMGSSAGTALTTNGFSFLTFTLGAVLTCGGVFVGALKTALLAEKTFKRKAVQEYLFEQAVHIADVFSTGFFLTLTIESIQRFSRLLQTFGIEGENQKRFDQKKREYTHYIDKKVTKHTEWTHEYGWITYEKTHYMYVRNSNDLSGFVPPPAIPFPPAYRLDDTIMNAVGGIPGVINANLQFHSKSLEGTEL